MIHFRLRAATMALTLAVTGLLLGGAALADPSLVWTDQHDGGANYIDDGFCLLVDPDGHLVVGGESTDPAGGVDMYIRKLDRTDGHELWSTRYIAYDDKDVAICEMTWDTVGQLLVAGFIRGCVG